MLTKPSLRVIPSEGEGKPAALEKSVETGCDRLFTGKIGTQPAG